MQKNLNEIKVLMLNEFENQIDIIFDKYFKKGISPEDCKNSINWLTKCWGSSRVDIKNHGNSLNSIKFNQSYDGLNISFPKWFENDEGKGCLIEYDNRNLDFNFNCINDGKLNIILRGKDYRNVNNQRAPVYINFTKFVLNDTVFFNNNEVIWHDEPYNFFRKSFDSEEINIKLESKTIYDYFPNLRPFLINIVNNVNDMEIMYNDLKDFFKQEKLMFNLNNVLHSGNSIKNENSMMFFNSLNQTMDLYLLANKVDELSKKIDETKRENDAILKSYNNLFNSLFIYNHIEPKKLVKDARELTMQVLDFIDNVCKKYDLKWWLHGGTLLGAIRHQGFIPWDDDVDINMMREDYETLLKVFDIEIKNHGLSGNLEYNTSTITNNGIYLPFIKVNYWVNNDLFAFIDIFPKDYVYNIVESFEEICKNENRILRHEMNNGADRKMLLEKSFEKLHVSKEKTNLVMCGIEDPVPKVYDYDIIFPLKSIKFEDREYPCPNDYKTFISDIYGEDYMKIPQVIYEHGFYDYISKHENVYLKLEEAIAKLKEANNNF